MVWKILGRALLVLVSGALSVTEPATAGEWPQLLGEQRDGWAPGERLNDWQAEPPEILWSAELGAGYAGCVVRDGKVYVTHRLGDQLVLDRLDALTGARQWRGSVEASYRPGINPDDGPRSVPVLSAEHVLVQGADGRLSAFTEEEGALAWTVPLRERFDADDGFFGAGSTPLVYEGLVIVAVGGRRGAGIVALRVSDGEVQWNRYEGDASYSSPVLIDAADSPAVLMPMRLAMVVVQPQTGEILGEYPFGVRGSAVTASTPIVRDRKAFLTASYRVGAALVDFQGEPEAIWTSQDAISSQYPTPVLVQQTLFGFHGREDTGLGELRAIDWGTGDLLWSQQGMPPIHLIVAENGILGQTTEGKLLWFEADRKAFRKRAEFALPEGTYRALPALAGGVLYCRTTQGGQGKLIALRIAG